MTIPWPPLGARQPRALIDSRLVLHHAAWVLGSAAHGLIEHASDDSHTNLGFDPRAGTLSTRSLGSGADAPELHLRMESLALELRATGGDVSKTLPLAGQTMSRALEWVEQRARAGWAPGATIERRHYEDFPAHPIGEGCAFDPPDTAANAELVRWLAAGLAAIGSLSDTWPSLTGSRVWPHHFDLGALIPLASTRSAASGERMLGLGLSLGDQHYRQPYFYCSPYPQPPVDRLPGLSMGHWHREGFVSSVLTAEELLSVQGDQRDIVLEWLQEAVSTGARILTGD